MGAKKIIPDTLPDKPVGWTRNLVMHLNFGSKGGSATYQVCDPEKRETVIQTGYDTRSGAKHPQWFAVEGGGDEMFMSWAELVKAWPRIASACKAVGGGQ